MSFGSLYGWLEDETFRDDVQREEAVFELTLVARLQDAARRGSYRAAMFLLERGFPERWGRKEKIELSGPDRGPISVQRYEAMPDTELDAEFLRVKRIADEAN